MERKICRSSASPTTDAGIGSGGPTGSDAGYNFDAGGTDSGGCDPRRAYRGNLDSDPDPDDYYYDLIDHTNIERLRGVSVITGFVRLGPSVTDLSALSCVTRITGYDDPVGPPHESGETRYGLQHVVDDPRRPGTPDERRWASDRQQP